MEGLRPVPGVHAGELQTALYTCEKITSQNRSSLYFVSQFMKDRCRYEAFLAMYSVMRVIDDFVDAIPNPQLVTPTELRHLEKELEQWRCRIEKAYARKPEPSALDIALSSALMSFSVPFSIWESFLKAMEYDLHHSTFDIWQEFLRYAEGAAVAPTAIFLFLIFAQPVPDRSSHMDDPWSIRYEVKDLEDGFDYRSCAHDLGIFAYLSHVLRDVREDLSMGEEGRVYIAISDLEDVGMSLREFRECVTSGLTDMRWRHLVALVTKRAHRFEVPGVRKASDRYAAMEPDCRFILALIIAVYQDLLGRIETDPDSVLRGDGALSKSNHLPLIRRAAKESGYVPADYPELIGS
jgi:phytoene synthase